MFKRILFGLAAGLIASIVSLILAYLVGIVVTLYSVGEFAATALAALTVLPIMLLVVVMPLGLVIAAGTGVVLGVVSHLRKSPVGALVGALVALVLAEISLSVFAPRIFGTVNTDFTDIIGNPLVSGSYGAVLGGLTGFIFRRFAKRNSR